MTSSFTGAVLTGGSSSRMGVDKSLLVIDGAPLAARVAGSLRESGAREVLAIGGDHRALEATGAFDRVVADRWPGEGPLGGILTAISSASDGIVVVLACDTPQVRAECPTLLVGALVDDTIDVAVGKVGDRIQPLTAAWRASTCAGPLLDLFERGERAPRRALHALSVREVDVDRRDVDDVDRPVDLSRYAPGARDGSGSPDPRSQR